MEILFIVGGIILFILFVRLAQVRSKTSDLEVEIERAKREVYEPEEEFYDPETGKSYTFEEVSKEGFSFGDSDLKRIPTVEEIEFLYTGEEETLNLLLRHIRTLPYHILEDVSPYEEALSALLLFHEATYWNVEIAVDINPTSRVLMVEYERRNPNRSSRGYSEFTPRYTVLVLHRVIPGVSGHHLITSSTMMMNIVNSIAGTNDQLQINGFETLSVEPSSDVNQVNRVLSPYLRLSNPVIEINRENLYIVINRLACIDDFDILVRVSSESN